MHETADNTLRRTTIHFLGGAPSNREFSCDVLLQIVLKGASVRRSIENTKVLIVNEVSMFKANVMDSLDHVFRCLSPLHAN